MTGKKSRIKSDYDVAAKAYNKRYAQDQFNKFKILASLGSNGKILDLGGGTGLLSKHLHRRDLINIDISLEMLKLSNCRNICADIDYLPIKAKCIDNIVSFTALQNLPSFSKVFDEARRVLKQNGIFVCSVLNKVNTAALEKAAKVAGFKLKTKSTCGEDILLNLE